MGEMQFVTKPTDREKAPQSLGGFYLEFLQLLTEQAVHLLRRHRPAEDEPLKGIGPAPWKKSYWLRLSTPSATTLNRRA